VLASRFAAEGRRGWAAFSWVAGVVFLVGFAGLSASAGASWSVVSFIVALVVVFAWISAVAVYWYRRAGDDTNG
jgi:hypothetical protein